MLFKYLWRNLYIFSGFSKSGKFSAPLYLTDLGFLKKNLCGANQLKHNFDLIYIKFHLLTKNCYKIYLVASRESTNSKLSDDVRTR